LDLGPDSSFNSFLTPIANLGFFFEWLFSIVATTSLTIEAISSLGKYSTFASVSAFLLIKIERIWLYCLNFSLAYNLLVC
jgi:hypothetical protein